MASYDGETTSSSEILWMEILSRIPFVKYDENSDEIENKVKIGSKIEVEEEDAMQLEQWICNQEVIISHSCTMQPLQYCRGIVEYFEYQEKNLKVTVSTESELPIWEDTDIWMFSTPNSSFYNNTEPNTSVADLDPIQEEEDDNQMSSTAEETDDEKLFRAINGWKLVSKRGYRERRKIGEHWKNVYFTELEMTTVDPMEMFFLKNIKEGTALRFSDDIEEPGDVLVDVVRTNIEEGSIFTITLGVTGFLQTDVNISLSKEQTYYLNVDDGEFDDMASVVSEPSVLPGYPLRVNIDELCEKLGKLTFTDACIKSWQDPRGNIPFIRLIITSERKKNLNGFKLLTGHHVIIQSDTVRSTVSAVVSRVMKEEMILTLRGVQKRSTDGFFFSKTQLFTIQIDHSYENWLHELSGEQRAIEDLRQQMIIGETDILIRRIRTDGRREVSKIYASFTSKNEAYANIPIGTRVLLGKTWELEGYVRNRRKADFVFAVRCEDSLCETNAPAENLITFEIIHGNNLVDGAQDFELSKAFFFVDFDSHQMVSNSQFYNLLNARDTSAKRHQTVSTNHIVSKELKFTVFPLHRDKKQQKQHAQNKMAQPKTLTFQLDSWGKSKPSLPSSPSVASIRSSDEQKNKKEQRKGGGSGEKGGAQKNHNDWKLAPPPTQKFQNTNSNHHHNNNNNKSFQKNLEEAKPQKGVAPKVAPKGFAPKPHALKLAPPPPGLLKDAHPKGYAPKANAPKAVALLKLAPPPSPGPSTSQKPSEKSQKSQKFVVKAPLALPPPPPAALPPTTEERNLDAEKRALKKVVDAGDEPWKVLGEIDEKHKRLCYVYITRFENSKNSDTNLIQLKSGLDEHGEPTKTDPWALGTQVVLTPAKHMEIKLNGEVVDTKGIPGRGHHPNRQEEDGR